MRGRRRQTTLCALLLKGLLGRRYQTLCEPSFAYACLAGYGIYQN